MTTTLSDQKRNLDENFSVHPRITRAEEAEINLESNVAQVVTSVRRSGKSTVCQRVNHNSGLLFGYVNFDDERLMGITAAKLETL